MATLFDEAFDGMATALEDAAGVMATITRGAASFSTAVVLGRRELAAVNEGGAETTFHATDLLMQAENYDFGAGAVEPLAGDRFALSMNGVSVTLEVMDQAGGKHFDYSDAGRTRLRIHTKQIA